MSGKIFDLVLEQSRQPGVCGVCGQHQTSNRCVTCDPKHYLCVACQIDHAEAIRRRLSLAVALFHLFDLPLEATQILSVSSTTQQKAEAMILGCEKCTKGVDVSFEDLIDRVTGLDPAVTQYILGEPSRCPRCLGNITETTLVKSVTNV
jgi:hypothetical protein